MPSIEMNLSGIMIVHASLWLSCPAQVGHPVITALAVVTGSSAFADDDSGVKSTSFIPSLRKRHQTGEPRQRLIEDHANDADHQDGGDHVGDRQVVSLV